MTPVLIGLEGTELTELEKVGLQALAPVGIFLFQRNCQSPQQLKDLIASAQENGAGPWVFIDQEGGRVQRLRAPEFAEHPSSAEIGALFSKNPQKGVRCAWLQGACIGTQAGQLGINAIAAPVLDAPLPGASAVIGERAFSSNIETIEALGRAFCMGLRSAGVAGVVKHVPGHGAAVVDSHLALPQVDLDEADLLAQAKPFKTLSAMTPFALPSHIQYSALDRQPLTFSAGGLKWVRDKLLAPGTHLISDCLTMGALTGSLTERALKSLSAGMDWVVISKATPDDWSELMEDLPDLAAAPAPPKPLEQDLDELIRERASLLEA